MQFSVSVSISAIQLRIGRSIPTRAAVGVAALGAIVGVMAWQ
jgi:hypothetical protein